MKHPLFHIICCKTGVEFANLQQINRPSPCEFCTKMYNKLKSNYL